MIGKASVVIQQVNDLIEELQNIKNPELDAKKNQINALSNVIHQFERSGSQVPNEFIEIQKKLRSELNEFQDSDEILFFIADELSKSIRKIKGLPSALENASRSHTYKSRDIPVTSKDVLKKALIETMKESGGRGYSNDIQDKLAIKLKSILTPADLELLSDGEIRWQKNVQWLRYVLTKNGVFKKNSPRGIWELGDD
jgi:hypothetical protein